MKIVVVDEVPVAQRPRRVAECERIEIDKQVNEWLESGVIRRSTSPYASPVVLVSKKNGSKRLCIDYRRLNEKIVREHQPLPIIEELVDRLQGSKIFCTLDLKDGFFHVPIEEESRKYTSFVTVNDQFEFNRVPFGLSNAPIVFTRFIKTIFREYEKEGIVLSYMDDLVIMALTIEEAIEKLKLVLNVAAQHGLKINWKKCQFLKKKIEFLGYVIEDGTIKPTPSKISCIKNYPRPDSTKKVQSFLCLCSYFRKFVQNFAIKAKPLSDLLKKDTPFKFDEPQLQSFETLKNMLCTDPVLKIFKNGLETEVHTDASKFGYGAALMQRCPEDGEMHPVSFMSRKTTPAEQRYHSYELEVLAVIEALKKYRIYLLSNPFKIVTDCKAFEMTMKKASLVTRVARWALSLQEFRYKVEHRSGKSMGHVDALSRITMIVTSDSISTKLRAAQATDDHITTIKRLIETDGNHGNYYVESDVLYVDKDGIKQIVVPETMFNEIIKSCHDVGHFAVAKTKEIIERNYFIPNLNDRISLVIRNCIQCILGNRKRGKQEGFLHPLDKGQVPLDTLHVDHVGPMQRTSKQYNYILVIIDSFTKFTWLFPTKSTGADEVLKKLDVIKSTFGSPRRVVTDKGSAFFKARSFAQYCEDNNIEHHAITTGVARENGQVERINDTVVNVLTKLSLDEPSKWYKYVESVQFALNATFSRSTKKTPFELLVGVKMRTKLMTNVVELLEAEQISTFMTQRDENRKEASNEILRMQEENRRSYDKSRKPAVKYKLGALVAIKRTQYGSSKIGSKYLGPYKITKVKSRDRYEVEGLDERNEGPRSTSTVADFMKPWSGNNQLLREEPDLVRRGRDVGLENCSTTTAESSGVISAKIRGRRNNVTERDEGVSR